MVGFFNKLFGLQDDVDFAKLIEEGAVVLDVRAEEEYEAGHFTKAINIPLDELTQNLSKLNEDDVVIAVCQSGMRSKSAVEVLRKNGFSAVYNGGSWINLNNL